MRSSSILSCLASAGVWATCASLAVHAALLAIAWQAEWTLKPPPEPWTVAVKAAAATRDDAPFDPLEPLRLPTTPIEPPPAEALHDPSPIEDPLDLAAPELVIDAAATAAIPPPLTQPPPLHRLRRRPAVATANPPEAEPPVAPIAEPVAPPAASPATPPVAETVDLADVATDSAPQPVYPRRAVELRLEGEVVLLALVRADGTVGACEVETSSGHPLLDGAAQVALRRWKFKPRLRDGAPRPFTARVPFHFRL